MIKRVKVAFCDLCGDYDLLDTESDLSGNTWSVLPNGWKHVGKKQVFCNDCIRAIEELKERYSEEAEAKAKLECVNGVKVTLL